MRKSVVALAIIGGSLVLPAAASAWHGTLDCEHFTFVGAPISATWSQNGSVYHTDTYTSDSAPVAVPAPPGVGVITVLVSGGGEQYSASTSVPCGVQPPPPPPVRPPHKPVQRCVAIRPRVSISLPRRFGANGRGSVPVVLRSRPAGVSATLTSVVTGWSERVPSNGVVRLPWDSIAIFGNQSHVRGATYGPVELRFTVRFAKRYCTHAASAVAHSFNMN